MNKYCEICECDPCDCHGNHDPLEGQVMKHEYIYDNNREFYYVPRAPSACEARTRASIFLKHFGDTPLIVNPKAWQVLSEKFKIKYLEE
jgi:hypothetical protein